jgi:DNA-binding FadR family transcriptional regulator
MAARRANEDERARFADLAAKMDQAREENDGKRFLELDNDFNQLLLVSARNEFLASSLRSMQGLSRRFWFANYRAAANLPETVRLHANIARAIAEADEEAAQKGIEALLDNVEEFTRATLDSDMAF